MGVLGIDLGTTYSGVARCDDTGFVEMVTFQKENEPMIPSVVSFSNDGVPIVGKAAANDLRIHENRAIDAVKREMNKEYCDKQLQIGSVLRTVSPIEPSACILRYLLYNANKELVNTYREPKVKQAVVTIPAAFNDTQREKTKIAAELAGIEVLGLLQEPTAAALAYGINSGETILVFDLGGGTLDVSIVKHEKDKDKSSYIVVGTPAGDDHLGGKDWDEALVNHILRKENIEPETINKHGRVWASLMVEAERCKRDLTKDLKSEFELNYKEINKPVEVTRFEFETVTKVLMNRAVSIVEKAIDNAHNVQIDRFILVGGSSLMPMVRKTLERKFVGRLSNNRPLEDWISLHDPNYAIAKGAAIYAGTFMNKKKETIKVEDKTTRSYGFQAMRGKQKVILNQVFSDDPCVVDNRTFTLMTRRDNQEYMDVVLIENDSVEDETIYECSNPLISKTFKLPKGLPKGTEVDFNVHRDKDGIIHVGVECQEHELHFLAKNVAEDGIINQVKRTISLMIKNEK